MTRPLAFPFIALEVSLAAKAGQLTHRKQLRLATAALLPDVDADGRAVAAEFLEQCSQGATDAAGEILYAWVAENYHPRPDPAPEFDWQKRRDLA